MAATVADTAAAQAESSGSNDEALREVPVGEEEQALESQDWTVWFKDQLEALQQQPPWPAAFWVNLE